MTKKLRLAVATILGFGIAVGIPLLERAIKCRQPASEGCVWAKAYLPLAMGLWAIAGLAAAVIAWFVLGSIRRK